MPALQYRRTWNYLWGVTNELLAKKNIDANDDNYVKSFIADIQSGGINAMSADLQDPFKIGEGKGDKNGKGKPSTKGPGDGGKGKGDGKNAGHPWNNQYQSGSHQSNGPNVDGLSAPEAKKRQAQSHADKTWNLF